MDTSRVRKALLLMALSVGLSGFARCGAGWRLVWQDEFDGAPGQAPNPGTWSADIGTGWGNQQLEYDTGRSENVALDGEGHLVITALRESYQGSAYTSARLLTQGKLELRYGRVEARIKLPAGRGIWPAFWMLGANFKEVGWPACGEIDIMELKGQDPLTVYGSVHGPGYSAGAALTRAYRLAGPAGFNDDFHVFALEWDEGLVAMEVDGEVYQVVRRSDLPAGAPWVFDQPFFLLLNVAVGGNFVGAPDASTSFPQRMVVDYVRVYEREL